MVESLMVSPDHSSRADRRRRDIIETARRLFIERGFHATGVAQIARESGIAVGQMYRDFASKEDIVAALVQEDCAKFLRADALRSAIDSADPESILTWILGLLESDQDRNSKRLFSEIVAESARNERIASIVIELRRKLQLTVQNALTQLLPDPALTEQRCALGDIILTCSIGLLHHELLAPDLEVPPLVQTMQTMIKEKLEALAAAHPAAPGGGDDQP